METPQTIEPQSDVQATPAQSTTGLSTPGIEFLRDVPLDVSVEIGRVRMPIGDILALGPSSVIELTKASNEPLDVRINGVLVARGEAVVVNDRFGIRLTSLTEPGALLDSLKQG